MRTQYVATRSSHERVSAALESQATAAVLMCYQKWGRSGIVAAQASREACISQERQDGVKTPHMSEKNDRSIQCRTSSKAPLRLAWLRSFPLVAAAMHQTMNMLWLIQRQFQLNQPTPVNTSNRFMKRAFGPVSPGLFPISLASMPAQHALRGAFAC